MLLLKDLANGQTKLSQTVRSLRSSEVPWDLIPFVTESSNHCGSFKAYQPKPIKARIFDVRCKRVKVTCRPTRPKMNNKTSELN